MPQGSTQTVTVTELECFKNMLCTAGPNIQVQILSDPIEKSHTVKGEGCVPHMQTRWAESRRVEVFTKANRKLKTNSSAKHQSLLGPRCEHWSFVHTGKTCSHRRCRSVTYPKDKARSSSSTAQQCREAAA